jgi:hypothetical protein
MLGAENSRNMAVFAVGSWSCSPSTDRPGRQYSNILHMTIYLELIHVHRIAILALFPSSNFTEGYFPTKVMYDLTSLLGDQTK